MYDEVEAALSANGNQKSRKYSGWGKSEIVRGKRDW
jgi:hypothetical protein